MTPTPSEITQAREKAGLTKTEAASLVHMKYRSWHRFEKGDAQMTAARWELFVSKTKGRAASTLE